MRSIKKSLGGFIAQCDVLLESNSYSVTKIFLLVSFVVFLLAMGGFVFLRFFFKLDEKSSIGDIFSVINVFFSGLAFAGLIVAIFLQRKELQLQREELEETRRELKKSADAQLRTENVLSFQVMLNAYDGLIRKYEDDVRNFKNENEERIRSSRHAPSDPTVAESAHKYYAAMNKLGSAKIKKGVLSARIIKIAETYVQEGNEDETKV